MAGTSFWSPAMLGLVGTGVGAATNLIGAKMAANGADRNAALLQQGNRESIDWLKQQDARDFAEYLKERERGWGHEDQDRAYTAEDRTRAEQDRQLKLQREREREGRLAPFREGAANGYKTLSSLLTMPNGFQLPASVGNARAPQLADLLRG